MKEVVILEKEFTETYYKCLQKPLVYIKKNLMDSDGDMCLEVDS